MRKKLIDVKCGDMFLDEDDTLNIMIEDIHTEDVGAAAVVLRGPSKGAKQIFEDEEIEVEVVRCAPVVIPENVHVMGATALVRKIVEEDYEPMEIEEATLGQLLDAVNEAVADEVCSHCGSGTNTVFPDGEDGLICQDCDDQRK